MWKVRGTLCLDQTSAFTGFLPHPSVSPRFCRLAWWPSSLPWLQHVLFSPNPVGRKEADGEEHLSLLGRRLWSHFEGQGKKGGSACFLGIIHGFIFSTSSLHQIRGLPEGQSSDLEAPLYRRDIQGLLRLLMSVSTSKPSAFSSKKQVHKPKKSTLLRCVWLHACCGACVGNRGNLGEVSSPLLQSPGG